MIRRTWFALLMIPLAAACGGKSTPPPRDPDPPPGPARQAVADDGDDDDGLELVSHRGRFEPDVIERALARKAGDFEACYSGQVGRRRWLGGGVELTWKVEADGALSAVHLSRSDLGAWAIEKCLLDVARAVSFGKPRGGKATVVTPLAFSAGSGAVAWTEDQATRSAGPRLKDLAPCARDGGGADPTNVTVTLYVGTRGKVQSVGFASPTGRRVGRVRRRPGHGLGAHRSARQGRQAVGGLQPGRLARSGRRRGRRGVIDPWT